MNKAELIDKIAGASGITKVQAGAALNATIDAIKDALKTGDKVTLVGFGTFSVGERKARTGRNPKTGKELNIAAKKAARFKAGKNLDDSINPAPKKPSGKKGK